MILNLFLREALKKQRFSKSDGQMHFLYLIT